MKRVAFLASFVLLFAMFASAQTVYTSSQLGFSVDFPKGSTVTAREPVTTTTDDKTHTYTGYRFVAQTPNGVYVVLVTTYDETLVATPETFSAILGAEAEGARDNKGVLSQIVDCPPSVNAPACKIGLIHEGNGKFNEIDMAIIVGNRLYQVMFEGTRDPQPDLEEVQQFLASFRLQ